MLKRIVLVFSGISMFGCALISNEDALARESAKNIGGGFSIEQIKITNVDRGITTVKWQAGTPKGIYSCSADDMLRSTYCAKK